ncbi:MAG: dephospho-CoA kinase, partial [Arenicella sp.]
GIMASQASREERVNAADDIIHNNKDIAWLRSQVMDLHQIYLNNGNKNL